VIFCMLPIPWNFPLVIRTTLPSISSGLPGDRCVIFPCRPASSKQLLHVRLLKNLRPLVSISCLPHVLSILSTLVSSSSRRVRTLHMTLSSLASCHLPWVQKSSSTPCSKTLSLYVVPFMWESKVRVGLHINNRERGSCVCFIMPVLSI